MGGPDVQSVRRESIWSLAAAQHWVVSHRQLIGLGLSPKAIKHRIARGRLHPLRLGVYAVGRPDVTREGRWMGAVLACRQSAVISDLSAGELWGLLSRRPREVVPIEVTVPVGATPKHPGLRVHRRRLRDEEVSRHLGIPVTSPVRTLLDLAARLDGRSVERAINEADRLGLADPETVRGRIEAYRGERGVARLRQVLERETFALTESELERRFLPLARRAGLPKPLTGQRLNGFRVDFFWPSLGLVVETDGLRYHRTPAQQARDRLRDQRHAAAGLVALRFTHAQVARDPRHVIATLAAVAARQAVNERSRPPQGT
jgi:very-short-patch-repair endonuclease/predicted transcriptional regulator of viral defense system